jgi:hypothetical protein
MMLVLVARIVFRHYSPAPEPTTMARTTVNSSAVWGVMKEERLMLDRPPESFQRVAAPEVRWVFGSSSPEQVREVIRSVGLQAKNLGLLLDEKNWVQTNGGVVVTPPLSVVREMTPGPRQKLYDILARTPENLAQRYPYVFRGAFEDWFADCPLPPERVREVRRMVYKKDKVFFFADLSYFQLTMPSNEVFLLARQVSRVPAVMASLEVKGPAQLHDLKRYWLPSGEQSEFDPLTVALARTHANDVNVAGLLPPLPRRLLYSYPTPSAEIPRNADCVWTSMNFFNEQPDNRFVDQQFLGDTLNTQYKIVPKADALGDIILLHRPSADGNLSLIHMCVHIAGDVVFTKNGGDIYQPWVLMRLEDVRALFSYEREIATTIFRKRGRNT